jgi:hypothetical protein
MMGEETASNMYSIDSNKEYCITLHLVGIFERKLDICRCYVYSFELLMMGGETA